MKVRDSGMPGLATWEGFFDPVEVLRKLAFDPDAEVVDFGCGYGTFTVAAARMTTGTVLGVDIDAAMVDATAARAAAQGLTNVRVLLRDFDAEGSGQPDASAGYAMLFNVLHAEKPMPMVREAFRVLRPGGKIAVIHWVHDARTPRGPELAIRPQPSDCRAWLAQAGFRVTLPEVSLPPWHFGVVGIRP